jgi:hypothetical protein
MCVGACVNVCGRVSKYMFVIMNLAGWSALFVLAQADPGDGNDPRTKAAVRAGLPTGKANPGQPAGRLAQEMRAQHKHTLSEACRARKQSMGGYLFLDQLQRQLQLRLQLKRKIASRTPSLAVHMRNSNHGITRRQQPEHSAQPMERTGRPSAISSLASRQTCQVDEKWNGSHRVAVT